MKTFIILMLFSSFAFSNETEQKVLSDWLTHEYGETPVKFETIHEIKTKWPFSEHMEKLYFHKYTMTDGTSNIGITGPVTFSLASVNQNQYTNEELTWLYTGWFIDLGLKSKGNHDEALERKTCSHLTSLIPKDDFKIEGCIGLFYKEFKHSAIKVTYEKSNGYAVIFAYNQTFGDTADIKLDFTNLAPVFYYYLGREYLKK
ncbi:hypothetical protein [Shewanella nanhaiensis]|uniref:Uncharacterized protein n=1 Tax=Shewanella nanhaiensis TaxID=2864872 RepID=A0ABS7E1V8_9GAMM|nr:hypothetical protein [Shewanella nanhaiensis]MBW8182997.1 hypothetical protein [Shewanella nanhaiensis]